MTPVRRNALLLALGLVFQSGMIQLAVALGTVTIVAVTGIEGILGLGPAVFLIAGALAVGPAGRLSDRVGRMPVIRVGFLLGIVGPAITAGGCATRSERPRVPRARNVWCGADDRASLPGGSGRDVPARAPGARNVDRALRRRLGCDLGAARLRADVRGTCARCARARRPVARGGALHGRRPCDLLRRPARPEDPLRGVQHAGARPRRPAPLARDP